MSTQTPSVGRIVHYILPDGPNAGEVRPALIVREGKSLTLQVFADQACDGPAYEGGPVQRSGVEEGKDPGQWCWPTITVPVATAKKEK